MSRSRLLRPLALLALALFGAAPASGGCGGEKLCVPGSDVFCRCPGTNEAGTKHCAADGMSFEACVGPHGTCDEAPQVCTPGEVVFCGCDSGAAGTKECLGDGSGFGDCACEPVGGSGGGGSGGSGGGGSGGGGSGGGTGILFQPCASGSECASGLCPMGFCTKACFAYDECFLGTGECVSIDGSGFCFPVCDTQLDCNVYGPPSECGYADAIDGVGVTTCADWLSDLAYPPDGTTCMDDVDCNLGHDGSERVCVFDECTAGCRTDLDCPGLLLCSGTSGNPGTCS